MGSGGSRKATPTVLKGYRREISNVSLMKVRQKKVVRIDEGGAETTSNTTSTNAKVIVSCTSKLENNLSNNSEEKTETEDMEALKNVVKMEEWKTKTEEETKTVHDSDFIKTIYCSTTSEYPLHNFGKIDYNVNAYHGGRTAMHFVSTTSIYYNTELFLVRSGYDGNHVQYELLSKIVPSPSVFYEDQTNSYKVDEEGMLIADCYHGNNHIMLLTNDSKYGNLRNGVCVEIQENNSSVEFPLNVNGGRDERGSGITLILCSGGKGDESINTLYLILSETEGNKFHSKAISGEDKYEFSVNEDGCLCVSGPAGSRFGLWHNRDNLTATPTLTSHTFVSQTQCLDGNEALPLVENVTEHAAIVVLCSNSNGMEDSTVSSVYHLVIKDGNLVATNEISGCHGTNYKKSDLWNFEVVGGCLLASGPTGPCRYGVLSNIIASKEELQKSCKQDFCLATGESTKTKGGIEVTLEEIKGHVNKPSEICVMLDHKIIQLIPIDELSQQNGSYSFKYLWKKDEGDVGHYLVRVFAIRKHVRSGEDIYIELTDSPRSLIRQKPGVIYAVNVASPVYQDMNDIVYSSEFSLFANFDPTFEIGTQWKAAGLPKHMANLPASLLKTNDGFLYTRARRAEQYNEFDHRFTYKINDLPNGTFKLRLHLTQPTIHLVINGNDVNDEVHQKIKDSMEAGDLKSTTAYYVDINVEITENCLLIHSQSGSDVYANSDYLCAFALLDKSYKDKAIAVSQIKEEDQEKHRLADKALPMNITVTRKEITVVGWSPNLLKNASGENKDMKHWNTSGDIRVCDASGYGTEACFKTSHMWSGKYQEVNLLDHFAAEYLDKAPDIQVSEWYKQGHCSGGFYCFTAQLMSEDGQVIKEYTTGELGSLTNNDWQEASVTFSAYGSGVRIVTFSSKGKDDKYWTGYFGPYISAAGIRVKKESKPAKDDSFSDIDQTDVSTKRSSLEKMVTNILTSNQSMFEDLVDDKHLPVDQEFEKQTDMSNELAYGWKGGKRQTHKKREIRVFVSSTFRDFTLEREAIIKKAFRDINRLCVDRGVFFTYVDLRWGITTEQTNDGKTIAICLQEIERCRPYFICLMGDRFGWSQTEEKKDETLNMTFDYAIENNPNLKWIDNYRYNTSVTQLEIFHGVLNNPDDVKDKCFFYLRDLPSQDEVSPELYKRLVSESEWHKKQQDYLKSLVQQHPKISVKKFKQADEVSELIKQDLKGCVDQEFPIGSELTKLEQQGEAHAAFASQRCRVYIGNQNYFTEINNHRSQNISQPFIILGESGCGKSALVANWAKQVEDSEKDTFIFLHFIGSSADSAHYIKMIRRLFEEMKVFFNFDMQIPSSDTVLVHEIGKWLRLAGSLTKCVIVFDAVNQLDDGSGVGESTEHDLLWIPSEIPPNVFLLISTLPGRAMNACIEAGFPSMKVKPLQESQKMQIITDYLEGIYGKSLTTEQKEMIINVKQTSNPLYLKSLLDEVRMFGSFRTLTNKISEYLSAESPQDLFAKILERLEEEFEKGQTPRKDLVRDATTALWCSNRGMSESELVELLDIPSAVWSPFYISLYENLVNRNGILNFFHDHLRQAVERKYIPTSEAKVKGYMCLADFHAAKETSDRTVEELPFLLTKAGQLDRLKETITDLEVFYRLSDNEDGIFELIKAWKTLGGFDLSEEAYMSKVQKIPKEDILQNSSYFCKLYSRLGNFFLIIGIMEAAKKIFKTLIKQLELNYGESHGTVVYNVHDHTWKYRCKHPDVIKGLHELGTVYSKLGEYDKAVRVYIDAINRQNRVTTPTQKLQLCEGLLGLSSVYIQKEDMLEAKKLMLRALELATFVLGKKHNFVAAIFTRLGQLSYKQGRVDEALAYCLHDLKVTRSEVGTNHPRTAIVLNEIGLIYDDKNDIMAPQLYEAALSIFLETYGKNFLGTGTIRYNLGAFYFGTNHFAKAKYQFTESYRVYVLFLGEDHPETKAVKQALDAVSSMGSDE
ncbi:uncharacterized protein LOC127700331 [Mytilus californianus]|uniref:uncharacterized protein LOC127700331 n=1 Tax=Mytilus californianus TaxID=6549 RepID=UPI0022482350|nr:uncharacterized protein LOC127700331 [Mytilus californianus]